MQKLIAAARGYLTRGVSVIATDNNKRALFPWKQFQERRITDDEIVQQFSHPKAAGIAVICGAVSGNLEVIDIDCKNDVTGGLYDNIIDNMPPDILSRLVVIRTKSGGYHFYYRCNTIAGNQKFAMRPATESELKDTPHLKQVVLVESRAEGGYVIAPPTEGYEKLQGGEIATIDITERDVILEICRSFNEVCEEVKMLPQGEAKRDYGAKPWDEYNERGDVLALLERHGWTNVGTRGDRTFFKRPGKTDSQTSADFNSKLNLFKVFTTSSQFEPGKGYSRFGVYCLLEHGGDPSEAAKQLLKDGYGGRADVIDEKLKRPIRKLKEAGYSDMQIRDKLVRDHGMTGEVATGLIAEYDAQAGPTIATFWDVCEKGKITINRHKFSKFLDEFGGIGLYLYDENSSIYRIVQERDGFVKEISSQKIRNFVRKYIFSLEPQEPFDHGTTVSKLDEIWQKGSGSYVSESIIENLWEKHFNWLQDTKDTAFFPFKNGVVCITKDSMAMKSYGEVNRVIWSSQVIKRNVTIDGNFDDSLCEFKKFIGFISGCDPEKEKYCRSLIGYLLHKYKDSARPWSVILAEETDDEKKGGGTGKGILVKAIGEMVRAVKVDGKNFKLDASFAFQRMELGTKIVAIEDVRKNVDFEGFYSIITEGITVEKKHKDELYIPYDDSPKIMFTTNYTIPSTGVHAKRRQRVFEFASYFNGEHTPLDEFGHNLYTDWDDDEWNRFYNFMFLCVQEYLMSGVAEVANSEKLNRKHIRISYGEEFLECFERLVVESGGKWLNFGDEYDSFLSQNRFNNKDYSSKKFKKAISDSCNLLGYKSSTRRNRQAANAHEFMIGEEKQAEVFEYEF